MGSTGSARFRAIQDRDSIYRATDRLAETYWAVKKFGNTPIVDITKREYREAADNLINYFEENNESMITASTEYPDEIVWQFSGRDKYDGRFANFELNGGLRRDEVAANIRGNGYTIRFLLPTKLYEYAVDRSSMSDQEMKVINAVATQAIKEYRNRGRK